MHSLLHQGTEGMIYTSRDIFLLNQFPCKMVEVVAWVAGVDHKETTMTISIDDGDGQHVLPVLVRLQPTTSRNNVPIKKTSEKSSGNQTFAPASERRLAKRKATEEALEAERVAKWSKTKTFEKKDIKVGDTVRIIGKIDEWMRKKSDGSTEWVRQVVVDDNAGGSILAVDPEVQYLHAAQVYDLHQTVYCRPFTLPDLTAPTKSLPTTPSKNNSTFHLDPDHSDSYGTVLTSEAPSELSMIDAEPELRDPTKLRSSQLTDRTFRQYMLDHMTQETIRSLCQALEIGQSRVQQQLEAYFPEYRQMRSKHNTSSSINHLEKHRPSVSGVFALSTRYNSQQANDNTATPTQKTFDTRRKSARSNTSNGFSVPSLMKGFTPTSILEDERLNVLARLVVENEAHKEERRRRRRVRDGTATKKDLLVESQRQANIVNGDNIKDEYMLDEKEKQKKMDRLVAWAIRAIAEEGSLVQITLPIPHSTSSSVFRSSNGDKYGYLPLPSQLLFPLCVPHLIVERKLRKQTFRKKNDPKSVNGMTVDELTLKFKSWGEDGRWERIGDWNLEDCLEYGYQKGYLTKQGLGYWLNDDYEQTLMYQD
ncbi:uncharacterized protein L201_000022 [Kwoniella dendrophila CBS 6074]|uniref:Uncharacterized protein n=1 Tax=Kwoniella dendrophila CBS 6074 TaxID=1295534 RepID=A0AAX4JI84_9TREE